MRWDDVNDAIWAEAKADTTLAAIFGTSIRAKARAQDHRVPDLQFHLVSETGGLELWEPCVFQWDIWANSLGEVINAERALRHLFDQEEPITVQGVWMWATFLDSAELLDDPERSAFYGRAIRFRFTPIRECLRGGRST